MPKAKPAKKTKTAKTKAAKKKRTTRKAPAPSRNLSSLNPRIYLKYKICVSGAAETGLCSKDAISLAEEVGREVAKAGMVLVTGATVGIPYWAAKGAKEVGGIVIGVSPAASELAHVKSYRLPTEYHDLIIYTGFEYAGRNLLLTRSADAIITICGRVGTLNEFTITFEDQKPNAVLEGSGGASDMIREILQRSKRGYGKTVFAKTAKEAVKKLIPLLKAEDAGVHSPVPYSRGYQRERDDA